MPRVIIDGKEYYVKENSLLKECMVKASVSLPCGGNGVCGKCKVYVNGAVSALTEAEHRFISETEIASGVRLACFTRVKGDCIIYTVPCSAVNICVSTKNVLPATQRSFHYGAAVDIGTTTVAAALYNDAGRCLSVASSVNPQVVYGADVLTRAQAAVNGRGQDLALAIRKCVTDVLRRLAISANLKTEDIGSVVITGNTAMLCLVTETPVDSMLTTPFSGCRLFGEILTPLTCGIPELADDATLYFPKCMDAFLGADFTCALLSADVCNQAETVLLVDIGTNGEMALWHNGRLYACSTAAGPAFEGVGVSCGMVAAEGAIDRVDVVNHRLIPHVIGGGEARGICGSGLVDALSCLLDTGEMDRIGVIAGDAYELTDAVSLTRDDIQSLMVSKSAICSGIETLCHSAGTSIADVKRLYLAGGFAQALNAHNAARIGLIPKELEYKTTVIGNAALDGASQLLFHPDLDQLPPCNKVELATDAFFADAFIRNMLF